MCYSCYASKQDLYYSSVVVLGVSSQSVRSLFSKCALLVVLSNPITQWAATAAAAAAGWSSQLSLSQPPAAASLSRSGQIRCLAAPALPFRRGPVHACIHMLACFDVHVHACVVKSSSCIFIFIFWITFGFKNR